MPYLHFPQVQVALVSLTREFRWMHVGLLQEFFFLVGVLLRSSSPGNPHQLRFECSAVLEDLCADVITELFILKNLTRSYVVVSVCVFLSTSC